jgi:hypothetical protein
VHCLRVFRSSVPSDLLPSSLTRCPSGVTQGEYGSTRSKEWGVGPGGSVSHRRCRPAGILPAGHILEDTLPGPVRSQGRAARCDPELVARAQLQQAQLQRVPHRLGPHQPVRTSRSAPAGIAGGTGAGKHERVRESALLGAPVGPGRGRQSPDQPRGIATELAGWTSGELPGQVSEQLASWPLTGRPGLPTAKDRLPASA